MRSLTSTASLAFLLGIGALAAAPTASQAYIGIGINVGFAPPALPYYEQPPIPGYGYIWTPGYWAWDPGFQDYYWVPGTWILPPRIGYLWTPGYWGWRDGFYAFNAGYWGPHIGFYGGVNYGFGYNGSGYGGGEWRGNNFFYNRSVNNVRNVNITNVYDRAVINNNSNNRTSYNGGAGGVRAQPTPEQAAAAHEQHVGVTPAQQQHFQAARLQPNLRASVNHGAPPVAATARPAAFSGAGVVPARGGGNYHAPNPAAQAGRPGGGGYGPRPNEGQRTRSYAPNASENRPSAYRPAVSNEGYGGRQPPQFPAPRPQAQAPRPQYQAPHPQPQAPRPQPQAMRPPPPRPAPQQHAAPAPREEHPHEEHH